MRLVERSASRVLGQVVRELLLERDHGVVALGLDRLHGDRERLGRLRGDARDVGQRGHRRRDRHVRPRVADREGQRLDPAHRAELGAPGRPGLGLGRRGRRGRVRATRASWRPHGTWSYGTSRPGKSAMASQDEARTARAVAGPLLVPVLALGAVDAVRDRSCPRTSSRSARGTARPARISEKSGSRTCLRPSRRSRCASTSACLLGCGRIWSRRVSRLIAHCLRPMRAYAAARL